MQFLVFAGDQYYPRGGWSDFRGSFVTLDEARDAVLGLVNDNIDWWHIVNLRTQQKVLSQYDVQTGGLHVR